MMGDQRFPPSRHVRSGLDFRRAYQQRSVASDQNLVVYGAANGLPYCRLGLSVSRKVGGAVVRNRWKRLIREAFRTCGSELPEGLDLIVIPRPEINPELCQLQTSLTQLAHRVARKVNRARR